MTKVYGYVARGRDDEKNVIAIPDGTSRALCISMDKHWTFTREWDDLHIVAPLVEHEHNDDDEFDHLSKKGMEHVLQQLAEAKSESDRWEQNYLDSDSKAHHATVEAEEWKNKYDESEVKRINAEFHRGVSDEQLNDAEWKIRALETDLEASRLRVRKLEDFVEIKGSGDSGKVYDLETEVRELGADLKASRDAHSRSVEAHLREADRARQAEDKVVHHRKLIDQVERENEILHQRLTAVEHDRDEWKDSAEYAASERHEWQERAEKAENELELKQGVIDTQRRVMGEQMTPRIEELEPLYNESVSYSYWAANQLKCHVDNLDGLSLTEIAERVVRNLTPTVDPIEARAQELFNLAFPGDVALEGGMHTCRLIAEAEAWNATKEE